MGGGLSRSSSGSDVASTSSDIGTIHNENESDIDDNSNHSGQGNDMSDGKLNNFMKNPLVQKEFRVFLNKRGKDDQLRLFRKLEVFADEITEKYSSYAPTQLIAVKDLHIPNVDASHITDTNVRDTINKCMVPLDKLRHRRCTTYPLLDKLITNAEEVLIAYFMEEFNEYTQNVQQQARDLLLAGDVGEDGFEGVLAAMDEKDKKKTEMMNNRGMTNAFSDLTITCVDDSS